MIELIKKFFLVCSGANLEFFKREECKAESGRYAMIGAFVFLTATFASLSGGYALYVGFKSVPLAVFVGILWGAFIFTLDRFIVSTIRKLPSDPNGPIRTKVINKLTEIGTALPRLVLAVMIASTVAVPLELKYFAPEIEAKLAQDNRNAGQEIATTVQQGIPEIAVLEKELSDMDTQEASLRERRDLLRDQRRQEVDGVSGEGLTGKAGIGPEARKRAAEAEEVENEFNALAKTNAARRATIRSRLDELRIQLHDRIEQQHLVRRAGDGFLARLKALGELADDNPLIEGATTFLVLLLILVETAPVVIKLFAPRGPYDDLLEESDHKAYINTKKAISNFNTDVIKELAYYDTISEARRQLEEQLTLESMNVEQLRNRNASEIETASAEIAKARIDSWKLKELQRLAKAH